MKSNIKIILFFISTVILIGCDRTTKEIAKDQLKNKNAISYFHDTFRFEYAENTGAALNLGDNLSKKTSFWLLSILPLLFLLILLYYMLKRFESISNAKLTFCALILAGGLGNIIDRLFFDRHVTDFMILGIGNLRTGIFNFADLYVTIGVIGLLIFWRNKNIITQ